MEERGEKRKRKRRGNPLFDLSFLSSPVPIMHTWHCAFVLALSEQMSDDSPAWATDPSLPLFDESQKWVIGCENCTPRFLLVALCEFMQPL